MNTRLQWWLDAHGGDVAGHAHDRRLVLQPAERIEHVLAVGGILPPLLEILQEYRGPCGMPTTDRRMTH